MWAISHLELCVQLRQARVLGVKLDLPRLGALLLRRQRRVHLGAQPGPGRGCLLTLDLVLRAASIDISLLTKQGG